MSIYEIRVIDLEGLSVSPFIKFLRMEILDVHGYGPSFFGRVRYALNGVEQEEGLPMDLSKGIFIATLRDDQLGDIPREQLEKTLPKAAIKISEIVRKAPSRRNLLPDYDYPVCDEDCSVGKLERILQDYPYLKYDARYSEPPDVLRCRVTDPDSCRHAKDILKIARRLRTVTGESYMITYSGSSTTGEDLDEVWTSCSLRKFGLSKR